VRYYQISISDPNSGQVFQTSPTGSGFVKGSGGYTFSSYVGGQTLSGALNVEFDIPVVPLHTPQGQAYIRVWGIGLPMIGQASNLAGMSIVLSAGMKAGLPLANPAQAGILIEAEIYQAFGNWQGVNQTLDLIVQPSSLSPDSGVSFGWPANTPLSTAIQTTLAQAFPGYKSNISISAPLVQSAPEAGIYKSLSLFAQYLQQRTQPMGAASTGSANYPGVFITVQSASKTIYVYDNPSKLTQLAFQDLIGQPTWIDPGTVNFKTVLRSDIAVGNQIKFPLGVQTPYVLTSSAAAAPNSPASSKTAFQGTFSVTEIHHFANFRQPDAESWNTTFNAVAIL
jgi:hypothetical protein